MTKAKTASDAPVEAAPKTLPRFVGNARVVEYFRRIGPGGIAHAYLFHGPRGVGKTTFARTLALTLHCERPSSFPTGYCGACGPCRRGLAGSSGDTIFVDEQFMAALDPKNERKVSGVNIDVAHEIIRLMQMRSYEGGRLACIVPDFDNITFDYVYNTFLKELEEPDPGKIFMLTTSNLDRILPTIRSRSVLVRFDTLRDEEVAGALVRDHGETVQRATALARRAQGSLGDALAQRSDEGAALRDASRAWALACLATPSELPPMPTLGNDDPRLSLSELLRYAQLAVRDVLALALAGDDAVVDAEALADYRKVLSVMGESAPQRAADALALFAEAGRIAATNVAPATIFGWLQVRLRSPAE